MQKYLLKREFYAANYIIGSLHKFVEGQWRFICQTLESPIKSNKGYQPFTALPEGRYSLDYSFNSVNNKYEPRIKEFEGLRERYITHGHNARATQGNILVGVLIALQVGVLVRSHEHSARLNREIRDYLNDGELVQLIINDIKWRV